MAQLVVVEGPNMGAVYEVTPDMTLGSDPGAGIVLPDRRIARLQARFEKRDGVMHVRSLDAERDILLNSEVVRESRLQHGDMLTVGETIMLFNEDSAPRPRDVAALSENLDDSTIQSRQKQYADTTSVLSAFGPLDKNDQRLATLYEVANAIADVRDLDPLLDKILELVFDLLPAERGLIMLRDEAKNTLVPRAFRNALSRSGEMPRISRTMLKEVMRAKESLLTMDAMDDDRFLSGLSIVEQSIRSAMCVPLLSRDRMLGVVHLDSSSRSRAFDKDDLELLTGIAHQSASAIENVRIYQRRVQHTEDLISLGEATRQLSTYLRKETIYREAVQLACHLVKANRVSLLLLEGRKEPVARLMYSRGIPQAEWKDVALSLEGGLVGTAIRENRSFLVREPEKDLPPEIGFMKNPAYASDSFVVLPISAKGEVFEFETPAFGALCATDKQDGTPFTERDLQLLSILASQVGIALTNAELYERATVDVLTRLYVRRYFFQMLDELVGRSQRKSAPLTLMMLDLDHFKRVNDTLGHPVGDVVLRETGGLLKKKLREQDIPARYGGEEFAVICYDTPLEIAREVAERLRSSVEHFSFNKKGGLAMTVSIGLALLAPEDTRDTLIKKADDALYLAKEGGRNRVETFQAA